MENFERLSNKILSITSPCGIVFETYDLKKCTMQTVVGQFALGKDV
jgi:hypothetical protein